MIRRLQQSRQALGSMAIITVVGELSREQEIGIFADLWDTVELFEQRFSRFLPKSELSVFNNAAGTKVAVSSDFHQLLEASRQLSIQTQGLFNPFILPELQRAGYEASWVDPKIHPASYFERQLVPIESLILYPDSAQIPADSALDFGGIGKGYLLDLLRQQLGGSALRGYWISLGGDILCQGYDLDRPWQIFIQDALNLKLRSGEYNNPTGEAMAIATSGVTKRKGVHNGRPWHHLIDPRTGQPANTDILTATVVCRDAAKADVLAKCLVVLGSRQSDAFTSTQHEILGTLIQYEPVATNARAAATSGMFSKGPN
jgi:thiamine biosynthesis lipoprotein